jgi:RNA polymerase sigma-70 factor (ECF subfamily)
MDSLPAELPSEVSLCMLHERLLRGDPAATADFASAVLHPLIRRLGQVYPRVGQDLINQAAGETILGLIKKPASFDPHRASLEAYLMMAARGDLLNLLRKETRHRHRSLESVELSSDAGKYLGREDDPAQKLLVAEAEASLQDRIPAEVREGLTREEEAVLNLILHNERRTSEFVKGMGISHLSLDEQRRLVKRAKDRLKKMLERAGSYHENSP